MSCQLQIASDARDRGLTSGFLPIAEYLTHPRPKHDRGGVGATEKVVVFGEDRMETMFAEDFSKGQTRFEKKGAIASPKVKLPLVGGMWHVNP